MQKADWWTNLTPEQLEWNRAIHGENWKTVAPAWDKSFEDLEALKREGENNGHND